MSDTTDTIDSRDAFTDRLAELINAAELGGVDVEGGYEVNTTPAGNRYDVEVSAVVPRRD
ncbi:hypothetical protein ACFPYI_04390 [Halomarina salina]|uniref:Amphi-Trp domain-containing protein n=1 Tax=Halomarina salina TaxID=1872699 RepID=A0ABD5RJ17_9EURY|nr:hypothetical protein [Halomarina salina]